MDRKIEILAPGGDVDSIKAAIIAGADAIYCGLDKFNARDRATNINIDDLNGILNLAHRHNCQIFLTLNIIILENEIPSIIKLLNKLVNTSIDGIIIQDLGLFYLINKYFPTLKIHASTQLTTHNKGQIKFLSKLLATQANLSRELNIDEIRDLTAIALENNIETEVFVHGSYCISFSGLCYLSSVTSGKSGNRGRCSQPCRDRYQTTLAGKDYPLNLKDNSAYSNLKELADTGVDSLKIEGRIKKFDYVYTIVKSWKGQVEKYFEKDEIQVDNIDLYKVFNRDFSNGFLTRNINRNMFIDNPRDNSVKYLSEMKDYESEDELVQIKSDLYLEKDILAKNIQNEIDQISIEKIPLKIIISGKQNAPLKVVVETPDNIFTVLSESNLAMKKGNLNYDNIYTRFKAINNSEYYLDQLSLENISERLFLPFKEITAIRKRILFILNGNKEFIEPVEILPLIKCQKDDCQPGLSVLISDSEDVELCSQVPADIFFQLPSFSEIGYPDYIELFHENPKLVPWFPPILIGENYRSSIEFLQQLKPKLIVTNNTGIAFESCELGIPWIAGPYLNVANSYSLLTLKEKFNCKGSFVSNELNKHQIDRIVQPENFKLYYSIFHPILLMTSRQCLFHQVTGCEKNVIDENCIPECKRSTIIINLKNESFIIEKSKGNYHSLYHNFNFLNTDIVEDLAGKFSNFLIDLREIKTATKRTVDKTKMIKLFQNLIKGKPDSKKVLHENISQITMEQYKKGI
ncbi:U32 family peptidase [Methanococcoides sp. SA1]|nr:U32 family peptidase [Methanococcoides sp. SA1]